MKKKQKKSGNNAVDKLSLITAILNLITAVLLLIIALEGS